MSDVSGEAQCFCTDRLSIYLVLPWVMDTLQARAKGNFLYAKLVIDQLNRTISPEDFISFLKSEIPDAFADIYERIFFRYEKSQHKYVR